MASLKDILLIGAVIVLAIMLLFDKCNSPKPCPEIVKSKTDTIRKTDTVFGKNTISYIPKKIPVPYETIVHDSFPYFIKNGNEYIPAECPAIKINQYSDTIKVDTIGEVHIKDSVQGTILKRDYDFKIYKHTTTITNTNTIAVKQRNKLFFGIEAIGNQLSPVKYFGGSLGFQMKRSDNILIGGAGVIDGKLFYKAGVMFKLHL